LYFLFSGYIFGIPITSYTDIVLLQQVAGHFTYGVMAISAATFMFWSSFGSQLVPSAMQGGPISLALQLSCSVLVS